MMEIIKNARNRFKKAPPKSVSLVSKDVIRAELGKLVIPELGVPPTRGNLLKNISVDSGQVILEFALPEISVQAKSLFRAECIDLLSNIEGVASIRVQISEAVKDEPKPTSNTTSPKKASGLEGVKNILAVASGKGGVGKSTTSVQLAIALNKAGFSVGLLDADIYGPSLKLITGAGNATQMDGESIIPPVALNGIKTISIAMFSEQLKANVMRGPMVSQLVKQFLNNVKWGTLDYLIIDYPPGTGDIQLTLSQNANITGAVIVTTPQEVALIDARKAVSMFEQVKIPVLGVIETMSYFLCDGCSKKHYLFGKGGGGRVAAEYGLRLLAEVPHSTEMVKFCDKGMPESAFNLPIFNDVFVEAGERIDEMAKKDEDKLTALDNFSIDWEH